MSRIGILIYIFFIFTQAVAQVNTDSLLSNWNNISEANSVRFSSMKTLITEKYLTSNLDSGLVLTKTLFDFATEKNNPGYQAQAYTLFGQLHELKNNFQEALTFFQKAENIYKRDNNEGGVADLSVIIANTYFRLGDFSKALEYCNRSLIYHEKINDKVAIAWDNWGIGRVYYQKFDYPNAKKYQFIALALFRDENDSKGAARVLNGLGLSYMNSEEFDSAIFYLTASMNLYEELGNRRFISYNLNNIGAVFQLMGEYDKALDYLFQSYEIKKDFGDDWAMSETLIRIAQVYELQENYEEAIIWGNEILELTSIQKLPRVYKCLYESYKGLNKLEEAIEYNDLYLFVIDSLAKDQTNKNLQEMEFEKQELRAKAEQEKKDVIALKELQKEKLVRNGFVGGFAFVLLFAVVFLFQRNKIKKGKKRSDELLLNILPAEVAEELKMKGAADAKQFNEVTVMFTDFKGFTQISENLSPTELVSEIDTCFKAFDTIIDKHNIEKIKTIGDSYMCVGGLPVTNKTHAEDVVKAGLEILHFMTEHSQQRKNENKEIFEIRIGIHTGTVVAGIVGLKKFAYDIWGDTVNIASRMESSGEVGKINISSSTFELVKEKIKCEYRGKIQAKNKGEIDMYFVEVKA